MVDLAWTPLAFPKGILPCWVVNCSVGITPGAHLESMKRKENKLRKSIDTMAKLAIGVHIGSTTTNAVILQGRELIAKAKHPVTRKNEEFRPIIENVIDNFVASTTGAVNKPRLTRQDIINCTGRITVRRRFSFYECFIRM